ncbi:hypothetical protein CCY99_01120 [Helicobacter sp. 16-1353]|uniref:AAA family ATPase n=1 Tax=Helicobacter sp. 16-1353 TaxID=2004996 RepID=UPI000DCC29FD|nr:AAA family ATPase [Helicobacter sp. 16-1353]RAX55329.1 hypothetical protein CCY99_01120 [Helicobacter sp. 16-1353]
MRIALYGLPTAGKTFILDEIRRGALQILENLQNQGKISQEIPHLEVLQGSYLLKQLAPNFESLSEQERNQIRIKLAQNLTKKDDFIIDGHYAFGEQVVFTKADGALYDVFLYLYISPEILKERIGQSSKNQRYLKYDIKSWQDMEIEGLRTYCHKNNKDFYVLDNPAQGYFSDISVVLEFINKILNGFSCYKFAKKCADIILQKSTSDTISLFDGDKTLILEDSNEILGCKTQVFNGDFYSGFQSWRHHCELTKFIKNLNRRNLGELISKNLSFNRKVLDGISKDSFILTSGVCEIWEQISKQINMPFFGGMQMCADTKFFIAKILRENGKNVIAYGDGANDYFMLKESNRGHIVLRKSGNMSRSLKNIDLEGLHFV